MFKFLSYASLPYIGAAGFGISLCFASQTLIRKPAAAIATEASNNSSANYRECVFETIDVQKAAYEADRQRFIQEARGVPARVIMQAWAMQPRRSAAEIEMAERANLTRIMELCRLKYPCADGEVSSQDYSACLKRER
jgi:hypothetical protein